MLRVECSLIMGWLSGGIRQGLNISKCRSYLKQEAASLSANLASVPEEIGEVI